MKIIKLKSENVKRIKAVEIRPDGAVVRITGKNAEGKTSVLDSIMYALGGERAIPSEPIRKGTKKSKINLSLGGDRVELTVERSITHKGGYLKVTDGTGAVRSPQAVLDSLVGEMSFDPLTFSREKPRKQSEILQALAGLDLTELKEKEADLAENRRIVGMTVKTLTAQLDAMTKPTKSPNDDRMDVSSISGEMASAEENNQRIDRITYELNSMRHALRVNVAKKEELEEKIKETETSILESEDDLKNAGERIMLSALTEKMQLAQEHNMAIEYACKYEESKSLVDAARQEWKELNEAIARNREEQANRIADAAYPLDGLGVSDEGEVLFNDLPISQASLAEQLKISTAVAMALNPKLRVIRITDGSLLDSDSLKVIEDLAKSNDYQVWIEQVDESGEVGFYIEDGMVAAIDGELVND